MRFFIPKTLLCARRWGVWKLESNPRGGKSKKVPYSAVTGKRISHSVTSLWVSYTEAVNAYMSCDYDGLGFLLSKDDGLVFIDIDHCIDKSGKESVFAQEVMSLFPKTYTEYSQSGTGIHLLVKGAIPCNRKNGKAGIELYSDKRYMAITGIARTAAEPAFAQDALDEIFRRYFCDASEARHSVSDGPKPSVGVLKKVRRFSTPNDSNAASDAYILAKVRSGKNARIFSLLWSGNWEGLYKSQSEADFRLMGILYYYSGDKDQTLRLFSQSGLCQREKSRNQSYLLRTLSNIMSNTVPQESFSFPNKSAQSFRQVLTDTHFQQKSKR